MTVVPSPWSAGLADSDSYSLHGQRTRAMHSRPTPSLPSRRYSTAVYDLFLSRTARGAPPRYDLADASFAWAGGDQLRLPHYWRLQSTDFIIELDNTQNSANHIHTVYRDLRRDFGADLLSRHHERHH